MKKKHGEDILIAKYGRVALGEAVQYFLSIDKHCTIDELDEMCEYINRMKEGRNENTTRNI